MSAATLDHPPGALPADPPLPPLTRAIRTLGFLGLEGASLGLAGWSMRVHDRLLEYVTSNALPPHARKYVVGDIVAGAGLAVVVGFVAMVWRRLGGLPKVERVARRLAPLALIGPVPIFFAWQLWYQGRELTFLTMVAAFLLGLQALARVRGGSGGSAGRAPGG